MAGKADAVANVIARVTVEAGEQAASGHITEQMAELLEAAHGLRVYANGDGRWVIDVHWWARVAIHARLAVCADGPNGDSVLALTNAGRTAVTRLWAARVLADALRIAQARRCGREEAAEDARLAAEAAAPRYPRLRAAWPVGSSLGLLLGGLVAGYLGQKYGLVR